MLMQPSYKKLGIRLKYNKQPVSAGLGARHCVTPHSSRDTLCPGVTTGKGQASKTTFRHCSNICCALQMNGKQVVVSKLMLFSFKFDEVYGSLADCFHLEGGTLLCSVELHRANFRHSAACRPWQNHSGRHQNNCPCGILPFESVRLGRCCHL